MYRNLNKDRKEEGSIMKWIKFFKNTNHLVLSFIFILGLVLFISCSSSSDPQSGTFVDAPVAGLNYSTPTTSGTTDANGRFTYYANETVTFSVGGLTLGSAAGKATVTPLDIVAGATSVTDQRVTNMLVLLQTLDQDGDLNNGIQITSAIAAIVVNYNTKINFNQTSTAFAADANVVALLAALNAANVFTDNDPRPRTLRSASNAQTHFTYSTSERKIVNTQYGQLSGYAANATTWQFIGIPYAKPPIGDLRWKPPQAPTAWTGVRDAVAFGAQAPQNPANEAFGQGGMSEDCLYLNITTPKSAANLPVMVWFHGGGFRDFSGNQLDYNNAASLSTKGVILVTLTHRLGVFGYLAHPLLTAESGYGGSGNYGQLDLIAALTWVKNNIANFGGDPNNVTIFGQSGGGAKVASLMASPLAKGLFHKAICHSGGVTTVASDLTLAAAEALGTSLFTTLGVATLVQARAKTWTEIVPAALPTVASFAPNIDGRYLTMTMESSIKGGLQSDVPFMAGRTSGDLGGTSPAFGGQMAWRSTYNKATQYAYKFSKVASGWEARGILSGHTCDLSYVFNYPGTMAYYYLLGYVIDPATGKKPVIGDLNGNGVPGSAGDMADIMTDAGWNAADVNTTDMVMTMWTNFAKTGNPSTTTFTWPAYTAANDTYVEIDATLTVRTGLSAGW
jgi:para-nitrobenzyl esterase